ncbi:MAG TPA: zinc ribbon domain-containing protein [Armatimonadaceae bacterium]|nr:zinc ribbon domain-containing protein [Armatimonadaceae bacterium]
MPDAALPSETFTCASCGAEVPSDAFYCPQCGESLIDFVGVAGSEPEAEVTPTPVTPPRPLCPNCKIAFDPAASECAFCGLVIASARPAP